VVLGSVPEAGKVSLVAAFSPAVQQLGLKAGSFIGEIAKLTGGGGGGRPNLAQAGLQRRLAQLANLDLWQRRFAQSALATRGQPNRISRHRFLYRIERDSAR
jgi:alanyl-tRNA synthetase